MVPPICLVEITSLLCGRLYYLEELETLHSSVTKSCISEIHDFMLLMLIRKVYLKHTSVFQ